LRAFLGDFWRFIFLLLATFYLKNLATLPDCRSRHTATDRRQIASRDVTTGSDRHIIMLFRFLFLVGYLSELEISFFLTMSQIFLSEMPEVVAAMLILFDLENPL
jgi:hypothetical protein